MFLTRTVLLVDDQGAARAQFREMLRATGCQVVGESRNTDDALEKFERLRPDVVVIDVTLPGTWDALVVMQRIRRLAPASLIFATGTPSQGPRMMEALSMGAADFFLKPYQPCSVRAAFQRHL